MAESPTFPAELVFPPRYWWLRRLALLMVLCVGILVALRYLTLHIAKRRLAAEIAAIKASGEPLYPEDFLDQPAPAEDDAGPDLLAAGKMFVVPKQYQAAWNPTPGVIPANAAMVDAVLEANRDALAKVRAARGKRIVNWGLPIRSVGEQVRLPMISPLRQLSELIAIAAQRACLENNSREAIEYLRDWLVLARSLESQPMLISHLAAGEMQEQVAAAISMSSVSLTIERGVNGATESQVRGLIAELLDENETLRRGWRWAWQGERMINMQFNEAMTGDDDKKRAALGFVRSSRFVDWWMRPAEMGGALNILQRSNMCVKAAGAKNLPQAMTVVRDWENKSSLNLEVNKTSLMGTFLDEQFQATYYRRQAAVALAARLFRSKYFRAPRDTMELIPEFLPEAPLDCLRGKESKISPPY
jgi:hypothetical protein